MLSSGKVHIDADNLAKVIEEKLSEEHGHYLRMSNFGQPCERKLWYSINTPDLSEPIPPNLRLTFLIGHIIEEVVLSIAEQTEKHTVTGRQTELDVCGVKGKRDCVIDGVLIDVKSANSRSFDKFKYHRLGTDDPFGYIDQLSMYLRGSRDDPTVTVKGEAGFLAVDKERGHLTLDKYRIPERDWETEVAKKKAMLASPNPPPRAFRDQPEGKSGNRVLGLQCSYCPFKKECWKNSNAGKGLRLFIYSDRPVFFTWVAREPRVMEVKDFK